MKKEKRNLKNKNIFILFINSIEINLLYIFIILNTSIIPIINSLQYFRAFRLKNEDVILFSDEGIIILEIYYGTNSQILDLNDNTIVEDTLEYISFLQPNSYDGNYIFCRVNEYIYIIKIDDYSLTNTLHLTQISNRDISIVSFKDINEDEYILISYINDDKGLSIEKYSIDSQTPIKEISKIIEYDDGTTETSKNYGISCELLHSSVYNNDLLICFLQSELNYLNGLVVDPYNDLDYLYIIKKTNIEFEINHIKSIASPDKLNSLICYEGSVEHIYECIVFNIQYELWSDSYKFIGFSTYHIEYDFDIFYIEDNNEYFLYFPSSSINYYIVQLDDEFINKNTNDEGNCIINYEFTEEIDIKYSSGIVYTYGDYSIIFSYQYNDFDKFIITPIEEYGYIPTDFHVLNIIEKISEVSSQSTSILYSSTIIKSNLLSTQINSLSSSLLLPSSSLISSIKYDFSTKPSFVSYSSLIKSNLITTRTYSTYTSLIKSTIFSQSSQDSLIKSTFISSSKYDFSKLSSTLITTRTYSTYSSLIKSTIFSQSSQDSLIKSTFISSTKIDFSKLSSTLISKRTELISSNLIKTSTLSTSFSETNIFNVNISCPEEYPYEMVNSHKCIEECIPEYFFNRTCIIKNNSNIVKEKTIEYIRNSIVKGHINSLLSKIIEENNDIILEENDIIYQLTTTTNQNNNNYYNISTVKLGECENRLKEHYNISQNESLLIFKIDYFIPDFLIPIIEYEVYNPYTKESLELGICEKDLINISIPVSINENEIFKHDPNSSFYNDKCFAYKTQNGTDITLSDRQKEYNDKHLSLCVKNCVFGGYNEKTKKVLCKCNVQKNIKSISSINNLDILNVFSNFTKSINIDVVKCYKTFFCIEGIKNNIGNHLLLFILSFNLMSIFVFYFKGYKDIIVLISNIIRIKNIYGLKNKNTNKKKKKGISKNVIIKNKKKNINEKITSQLCKKNDYKTKEDIKTYKQSEKNKNNKKDKKNPSNPNYKKLNKLILNDNYKNNTNSQNSINNLNKEKNPFKPPKKNKKRTKKSSNNQQKNKITKTNDDKFNHFKNLNLKEKTLDEKIIYYTDNEINNLSYEKALIKDKRSYMQYYLSLLKTKHLIIFTFYTSNDYNSRIIKISLFLFLFGLYTTVNSLFFQDETMHNIYINKGAFNILYDLPRIIFSTLITFPLITLIKHFSLTEKNIIEIKEETSANTPTQRIKKNLNIINTKFVVYFVLNILFTLLFWYYLGCFCATFKNTQYHLLKDSSISFGLSMIYPFFINLLPGLIRIPSLRDVNKNKEFLYILSKFIQLI